MSTLNPDQQQAKEFFQRWWNSDRRFAVLEGCAGTGKTFIVSDLVKDLKNCTPLFTAPTNEACRQLELSLPSGSLIRTTFAALGFHFNSNSELKSLDQHGGLPSVMQDINLLIVDEVSMVGKKLLEAIEETGKKTLFIGHRSQLPEVVKNLSTFDDCESIVFKQEYPTYTLTTPVRNTGTLFKFISTLEEIIYKKPKVFKATYNTSVDKLMEFIDSKEGKQQFLAEEVKIICWSNAEVDKYNTLVRQSLFHAKDLPSFVPRDKILFVEPAYYAESLIGLSETKVGSLPADSVVCFSANTKATVRKVNLCIMLKVPCWELEVEVSGFRPVIYVPIDREKLAMLDSSLKQKCYAMATKPAREKAFRRYHFIMSFFAKVKHSYAITTHRSQGMTIPNVWVVWSDIRKCSNVALKQKLLYVASSRARDNLNIVV